VSRRLRSAIAWLTGVAGIALIASAVADAGYAQYAQSRAASVAAKLKASGISALPPGFAAKLTIPQLDKAVYVVDVKTDNDLKRGPGFITAARPGDAGNVIIAGHRDLHFRMLKDIKVGADIRIDSPDGRFVYRVKSIDIVWPTDTNALKTVFPRQLTLVTCYPFYFAGHAPKRFIVKADLI
jgi:sortase A